MPFWRTSPCRGVASRLWGVRALQSWKLWTCGWIETTSLGEGLDEREGDEREGDVRRKQGATGWVADATLKHMSCEATPFFSVHVMKYGGFHSHGGTPLSLDGFCERENPNQTWMISGYPHLWKPPYG